MREFFLRITFRLLSYLPLSFLRGIGSVIGVVALKFSKRSGKRLRANLLATGMCKPDNVDRFAYATARELGKTLIEIIAIDWQKSPKECQKLVAQRANFEQMLAAASFGPVVFLTPHVGNFEIGVKATSEIIKNRIFNVLYKPSKDPVFDAIMLDGRTEENIKPVPITRHGVGHLLRALKNGGLVGLLPDNVASSGDGVWVDFFGKKVFATTLAAKFVLFPKVTTFFVYSIRVKDGFVIDYLPYVPNTTDVAVVVQDLYKMLESIVLKAPTQFYWSYDRFRRPAHAPDPDSETTA
jgi:Kdo2-lipid IVA lauroyltransferase/acyltransferase